MPFLRHAWLLALLALATGSGRAHAQGRVWGELRVGGGYDSNPSLATDASNRRLPIANPLVDSPNEGVFRIGGFLAGRLGDSPSGTARFDLDGRVFGSGEVLFWEHLSIDGGFRFHELSPRCRIDGARLDLTFADDSSWSAGLACGASLRFPLGFWASADVEGGMRAFDIGQLDGMVGASIGAGWIFDPLAVEIGAAVLRRESENPEAARTDLSPWIAVRVATEYVGGQVAYRYVARFFDSVDRSGGEHAARLEVWGMPLPWIGGYVELELGHAEGGSQALLYDRYQIAAGVRLVLDWHTSAPFLREEGGPTRVMEEGRVRFRFLFPNARRVAVVGDFNRWDEERGRLERRSNGEFEGAFTLEPGRHEYHLLVDGRPVRPPGARRYVQDDFGSENAVFEVRAQ